MIPKPAIITDAREISHLNTLNKLFEIYVKDERKDFDWRDSFPLPTWSGSTWFNLIEDRMRRWCAHIRPKAIEWWRERGYDIAVDPNGRPYVTHISDDRSFDLPGTPLYRRLIGLDRNSGRSHFDDINRVFWRGAQFVLCIDAGAALSGDTVVKWLRDNLGVAAMPFQTPPRAGAWQWACAPRAGCLYIGFATREQMERFKAAFPGQFEEEP